MRRMADAKESLRSAANIGLLGEAALPLPALQGIIETMESAFDIGLQWAAGSLPVTNYLLLTTCYQRLATHMLLLATRYPLINTH